MSKAKKTARVGEVAKSATQKVAKAATKKVAEAATKKVAKSATQKVAKAATKKVAKAATKRAAKKVAESATKRAAKKIAESATKRATKKLATSTAKKSAAKKRAKSTARAAATRGTSATTDLAARVTAATKRLVAWLQAHARLEPPPAGASERSLQEIERAIGSPLPADLAAWWRLHDGGVPIFEYAGLGVAEALRRRGGLEQLRAKGTFADHEIFEQSAPRFAAVKWHPGWVPLAEDGCGNLYLVDTAPGPAGEFGQVLRWEVRGGAFAGGSIGLAGLLERYADALARGEFVYQPDSGTFDGPFLDMLADE